MENDLVGTPSPERVFLTGATGYIGGRLAPRLLESGHSIRCITRSASKLKSRPWANESGVEIVEGDVGDATSLSQCISGCDVAYYLVHSMEASVGDYQSKDYQLAKSFGEACAKANVKRIIYLGGLGETGDNLSKHLQSRREVESALKESGVPVTVLRAAMIIGSGSASFEILRYLVERLPIMITPRWVKTKSQPIAIRDVLYYLVECLRVPATTGRTIDIGGADILSYAEMMQIMAKALGLRSRLIIPVPVLTPKLSSLWIHLVTPLDASIARPLAEGLRNEVICRNDDAQKLMPHTCLSVEQAIKLSLERLHSASVETTWSDAGTMKGDPDWAGGTVFIDKRQAVANAPIQSCWRAITSFGGDKGYGGADWLWSLRGGLDKLVGGPGIRRGRRSPTELRLGDSLDFWRVSVIQPPNKLVLTAEMKLPGVATLTLEGWPGEDFTSEQTNIAMTARFQPRGLFGILYWYAVVPLHGIVFNRMLNGLVREAERIDRVSTTPDEPA
ncbi:SDR family oxidoreductase [Kamptonema cortianum]|nr:SDR family oxidoreductase [Geitlerinema splendidum]MDK3158441.1 SDR family oxidoreductase [Kamptonema cortianum]